MKNRVHSIFALCLIGLISLSAAQDHSLDIEIGKQIYSSGENVTYKVVLLKDSALVTDNVDISISASSDADGERLFNFNLPSNTDNSFPIEKEYSSEWWKIEALYQNKSVKRFFYIGEREVADFRIKGEKLIIKNSGNVPYTKIVHILIGETVVSKKQDIGIGEFKEIKLVAPDGNYNIQVNDGVNSVSKQNVYLTGTGQVIGALDENVAQGQSVLGGARDVKSESFFTSKNFSVAFIFIGAVFGLFVLVWIEKVVRKKRSRQAKETVRLH